MENSFITRKGILCYLVMAFGLRNVGSTYKWMVPQMFSKLLGKWKYTLITCL